MQILWSIQLTLFVAIIIQAFLVDGQRGDVYTQQERGAIEKFRPLVSKYLVQDFQRQDAYLIRWIRANKFDLSKAAESLKKTADWRSENNIGSILGEDLKAHFRYLPCEVRGFDKTGRPIAILYWGRWQLRKYTLAGKRDEVNRVFRQCLERATQKVVEQAQKTGKDIDQFHLIVQFDGFSLRETSCLTCVPLTLDIARSVISGFNDFILKQTLVNVPRAFGPVLALARSVYSAAQNLIDYDNDKAVWQAALFKEIDPNQLPRNLGGTLPDPNF
jgi:hypothetical protein